MESKYKTYDVKATFKHPAWDEKDGIVFTTEAKSKSDAIRYARREMREAGHLGVIYFKATEKIEGY